MFYARDTETEKQQSLKTKNEAEGERLVAAMNQAADTPQLNRAMAKVYASAASPNLMTRTWGEVMEAYAKKSQPSSQKRVARAFRSVPFKVLRGMKVNETDADALEEGEPGSYEYLFGAQLLKKLGNSRSVTASGEHYEFALSLVAWTILKLIDEKRSVGALPVALTGLAYITPVRLPELQLPPASEVLDRQSTSPETWRAYEEIRNVENRALGAIPAVASALLLWKELRHNRSKNTSFRLLLGLFHASSVTFRTVLEELKKVNRDESTSGGKRR
jgi:hypothetical protein